MSKTIMNPEQTIMSAVGADGVGTAINVRGHKNVTLKFSTASSAAMKVQFALSAGMTAPTFSTAKSTANHWTYVAVNDYDDASKINGSAGITLTGTDEVRTLLVNTDGVDWINAEVSTWTAGTVTVIAVIYGNN